MSKSDYLLIMAIVIFLGYLASIYISNVVKAIKQVILNIKSIETINIRLEKNIHDISHIYKYMKEDVKALDHKKDILRDRELNLINLEELCEINTRKLDEKKAKYETDLANCRDKNIKSSKQLRELNARLADLIIKNS